MLQSRVHIHNFISNSFEKLFLYVCVVYVQKSDHVIRELFHLYGKIFKKDFFFLFLQKNKRKKNY